MSLFLPQNSGENFHVERSYQRRLWTLDMARRSLFHGRRPTTSYNRVRVELAGLSMYSRRSGADAVPMSLSRSRSSPSSLASVFETLDPELIVSSEGAVPNSRRAQSFNLSDRSMHFLILSSIWIQLSQSSITPSGSSVSIKVGPGSPSRKYFRVCFRGYPAGASTAYPSRRDLAAAKNPASKLSQGSYGFRHLRGSYVSFHFRGI